MMMRAFIYLALLGSLIVPGPAPATAQDWPTRPVKVVAPVGPGGVTDTLARLTADRLAKMFGKPFVVENRAGGGGAIGTEYAARAPNDGYTFYFGRRAIHHHAADQEADLRSHQGPHPHQHGQPERDGPRRRPEPARRIPLRNSSPTSKATPARSISVSPASARVAISRLPCWRRGKNWTWSWFPTRRFRRRWSDCCPA